MTPSPSQNLDQILFYVELLLPWESEYAQLYKCVTVIYPDRKDPDGRPYILNHAFQSQADMVAFIDHSIRTWRDGNIFLALGTQLMAQSETYANGILKAIRKANNMVNFKALFIDIDVKQEPGFYQTTAEAEAGLKAFLQASGMPEPSMIVRSGSGGMHCYWCTAKPMPKAQWQSLAEALKRCCEHHKFKADPAVTADAARILRIPGSYNYKRTPPTQCTMDTPTAVLQYTAELFTGVLAQFMAAGKAKAKPSGPASVGFIGPAAFSGGIKDYPALPIDQIAQTCPMVAQTLADGGAGKAEPEWSQDIYLAAHTSDPADAAHRMSKGHDEYSHADTDAKLATKQTAIAAGDLGWPACSSFRHAACKTCPLLAQNKSPIMLTHIAANPSTPTPAAPKANDDLMPRHYWRDANDIVWTQGDDGQFPVLGSYPIHDGGINPDSGELVLQTTVSGQPRWGSVVTGKQTPIGICEALHKGTRNGITIHGDQKAAKAFIMAWLTHLQHTKKFITPHGFGWSGNDFIFGDEIYTPAGIQKNTFRGNTANLTFQRVGIEQPWRDAMALVYGNTAMEILVASSFAAPLVKLTCDYSLTLSIFSNQSGYGKSTAMKIAQAVWGQPREGMSMLDDTENSVNKKTGDLKNLPVYWDEMKTKDQIDRLVRVVFAVAQGRSKARLNRDSNQMNVNSSTTMLTVASNQA
jgi:hypothetical protein